MLAVAVLAACGAPKPVAELAAAPSFKIVESWACPFPAHRGLRSVDAGGRAEYVVFPGLESPPASRSERRKKQLPPADVSELVKIAAEAKSFPERAGTYPPRFTQTDPCDRSLEVTVDGATKRISYRDGDVPKYLADFLKRVDQIIERGSWEPGVYPWEKR